MPEPSDWKQKYHDSLREMEAEEKHWREVEQVLRRLIGRLCAAGMGVDPQLDDELTALAAANRRNADARQLEQLAESLTTAVVAVDATSPVRQLVPPAPPIATPTPHAATSAPPTATPISHAATPMPHAATSAPPTATPISHAATPIPPGATSASHGATPAARSARWESTCTALAALLARLHSREPDHSTLRTLAAEAANAETDAALAAAVARAADFIHERSESLLRERLQAAAVLSEVTKRLEEMSSYLAESNTASRSHFDDAQSLNDTVMLHVRELTDEVSGATELGLLQSAVSARLESVARQVCDFRAREATRLAEYNGRADHMRERIADLEREAQDLHSKLDLEKRGARLDPLTGVANRKSFDERFAQEVTRHAQGGVPLGLLLWDIDSFKVINDRYGHRAGDRVLQSVARCFSSVLRASDFVARIGGEEFAVLLRGLRLAEAVDIANQVRTAVEGLRFHFRGTPVRVTVSCGVTELNPDDRPEGAFDRADAALYRAKSGGKNLCIAAWPPACRPFPS